MTDTLDKQNTPDSGSDAPTCSLVAIEPNRRAVTKEHFYDALETIKVGETIEVHHPESKGRPTNMGVLLHKRSDGVSIRIYAACWGIVNDETIAWSYHCLEEIPENAIGEARRERCPT